MIDICPRCNCNNAPMVWLGKGKGCICEDCYDKEVKEHERDCNCNNTNNLCDIGGACLDRQQ